MLSVLRNTVDRDLEFNIKGFPQFADKLIAFKKNKCDCCGFRSDKFMRLVSKNNGYSVLKPELFLVTCPFCFLTRRLERAKDKAVLLYLPEITQSQLNMITHVLWHFSESKSLNSTQYHYANNMMNNLLKRSEVVESALGDKANLPENFAFALKSLSDEDYTNRNKAFDGIRLMPIKKGFQSEVQHWSSTVYPSIMGSNVDEWNALSSAMKRILPDVDLPD